jgi:hypothetical protein
MKIFRLPAYGLCLLAAEVAFSQSAVLQKADELERQGHFQQAAGILTSASGDKALPAAERKQLEFDLDRLDRIRKDFPFTKDELFTRLQSSV